MEPPRTVPHKSVLAVKRAVPIRRIGPVLTETGRHFAWLSGIGGV